MQRYKKSSSLENILKSRLRKKYTAYDLELEMQIFGDKHRG